MFKKLKEAISYWLDKLCYDLNVNNQQLLYYGFMIYYSNEIGENKKSQIIEVITSINEENYSFGIEYFAIEILKRRYKNVLIVHSCLHYRKTFSYEKYLNIVNNKKIFKDFAFELNKINWN